MIYKIVCVGKLKEAYLTAMIKEYEKKINKNNRITIVQLEDEKIPKNPSEVTRLKIMETEGEKISRNISNDEYVISLCINGKQCTGNEFRRVISSAVEKGYDKITFIIGGSLGLTEKIINNSDYRLSFSSMTFPHQLMRAMLLDAISTILE
jgi:23S rRNA (pseudouridine1915-N3)-methyltransferase